ncbi:TspO/MBR-related protein [Cutaneotrichosporon oleaginosum]|uniref:TspO/MBR-related protein n=1 Tax=Cutaneotrichosporon oleaginosum TaxID=879819 RepID=A0A0J0XXE7_9TREE|nr:TspO/MBR-related protein [Cutaneotrichosporon oleaginosum]KLT45713.1 TspO/MBR-related protein [Cutaneotrichosporon oleaginosum]
MPLPRVLLDIARNPWLSVGGAVVLGAAVAKVSNNQRAHEYYASLAKPTGNPPTWALGPIWGTLYGMLGYAAHILARLADTSSFQEIAGRALRLHYVQLALNLVYMPIFFQIQSRGFALVDILAVTGLTWKLVNEARTLPGPTFVLLIPYAFWMLYSTYLNVGLIYLNSKVRRHSWSS